ncbi:MFS transporter [uncultured Microbacterium sp.]|uniref:MFS transporter n=1 Tax=uncultured Microbacterium sp. TaxID=191216 RepID=UPI0028E25971|nr:MFS transporter [uncultured Microbacterium sp.]
MATAELARVRVNPWWVGVVAGMASFVDGAAVTANGFALTIYQEAIGLTPSEVGLLTTVLTFGVAVGAIFGGRFGDRFGRRRVFIATMVLVIIGAAGPTFGTDFWILFAGISILGLAVGADIPVSLATIAEAATDKNRGKILVFSNLLWGFGIMATVLVASTTGGLGQLSGQLLYGLTLVVAIIVLALRLTIPESTQWAAAKAEQTGGIRTVRAETTRFRDLLTAPLRRPFFVLLFSFTMISIPILIVSSYSAYIAMNLAGVDVAQFSVFILALFPVAAITQLVFMRLVDSRLRLPLYLAGGIMYAAAYLVPVVFGFSITSIVALILLSAVGSVFCGEPILRVWANEAFPTMIRGTAQGAIFTAARLIPALLLAPIPVLLSTAPGALFIGLTVLGAAGVAVGWLGFRGGRIVNEFDHEEEVIPDAVAA